MSVHTMRLVLGILFLILATVLFARRWLMPGLDECFDPMRMNLGAVLALVFGGLNLARWYSAWTLRRERATPVRKPLQPDPTLVKPEPPNPEFDFRRVEEKKEE